jgi:hypothetical protein
LGQPDTFLTREGYPELRYRFRRQQRPFKVGDVVEIHPEPGGGWVPGVITGLTANGTASVPTVRYTAGGRERLMDVRDRGDGHLLQQLRRRAGEADCPSGVDEDNQVAFGRIVALHHPLIHFILDSLRDLVAPIPETATRPKPI